MGLNFKTVVNRDGFNKQVHKCRLVMARRLVAVRCAARGDRTAEFGWRGQFQQHCYATLLFKHGVSDTSLALLRAEQFHGRAPVQRPLRINQLLKAFCVNVSNSAVRKSSNGEAPRHVGSWLMAASGTDGPSRRHLKITSSLGHGSTNIVSQNW